MSIPLDETLKTWLDVDVEIAKENLPQVSKRILRRSVLLEFEELGLASRHLRPNGKIGWRATSKMQEYLTDAQLDAKDDLGNDG